jgi:hypothetical protein
MLTRQIVSGAVSPVKGARELARVWAYARPHACEFEVFRQMTNFVASGKYTVADLEPQIIQRAQDVLETLEADSELQELLAETTMS